MTIDEAVTLSVLIVRESGREYLNCGVRIDPDTGGWVALVRGWNDPEYRLVEFHSAEEWEAHKIREEATL